MNDEITEINSFLPTTPLEDKSVFYCNLQKEEWMTLFFTLLTAIGVSVCSILIASQSHYDNLSFPLVLILVINCIFLVYYMLNGIINEKEYDLYIGYVTTFFIIIATCSFEFAIHFFYGQITAIKLARLMLCFTTFPISIYLICKIANEISWTEFKIVGASELFQDIYRQSGYFVSLLKVDFQLTVCALIMEFREGPLDIHSLNIQSIVLISLGIPFCLLFAIIGYKALRMESCKLTIIFTICHILIPIFVVYQIYEIYLLPGEKKAKNYIIIYSSLVFDAICLLSKGVLVIETHYITRNYNQGLKERAFALESDSEMQPLLYKVRRRKLKINSNCC